MFSAHPFQSKTRILISSMAIIAMVGSAFAPLVSYAQIRSVTLANPNVIGDAFQGAVDDTFQEIETGIDGAIDDGIGGLGSGNPIVDGVIQGVAGAAASYLSCHIGGIIGTAANAITAVPVADKATNIATMAQKDKECLNDGLAFALKEGIIKGILQGMITYINNGFSGGPGYLQDEEQYFTNLQDRQFNQFINNPSNFSSLCSAWEADVRLALATEYSTASKGKRPPQLSGTGTGLGVAIDGSDPDTCEILSDGYAASGADGTGFWRIFEAQTTNISGNPVTSYFDIADTFAERFKYNVEKEIREIQRTGGFFDVTYCDDGSAEYAELPGKPISTGSQNCKVTTPGAVINAQLNSALDSDLRRLELADEINEVFSALIGQLIEMVFSELGLFGTTERTGGSQSLIEQYGGSVNFTVTAASIGQLINQLKTYEDTLIAYIGLKERSASAILDAREVVFNTMACYESKYNTWGRVSARGTSNYVIDPAQVADVSEGDRERVTFKKEDTIGGSGGSGVFGGNQGSSESSVTTLFLTPDRIGEQLDGYMMLMDNLNGYIIGLQRDIDRAESNIDRARLYRSQLEYINASDNPIDAVLASSSILKLISDVYGSGGTSVSVELDDGTFVEIPQDFSPAMILEAYSVVTYNLDVFDNQKATQQATGVEMAVKDMLEGVELRFGGRSPGVLEDLEQCRSFQTIHNPGFNEGGSEVSTGGDK
ncbi:MAG: hypothetical protein ACKKL4_03060 [Patescibacteria group bacterium]